MSIDMIQQAFSDEIYIEPRLRVSHVLPEPVKEILYTGGRTVACSEDLKRVIDVNSGDVMFNAPEGQHFHFGVLHEINRFTIAQVTPTKFAYLDNDSFMPDNTFSELPESVQPFISWFHNRHVVCSEDGKRFYDLATRRVCLESRKKMSPKVISVDRTYLVNIEGTLYDTDTGIQLKLPTSVVSEVQKIGDDVFLIMSSFGQRFFDLNTKREYALGGKYIKSFLTPTVTDIDDMWLVMDKNAKTFYDLKTTEAVFELPEKVRERILRSPTLNTHRVIGEDSKTVYELILEKRLDCSLEKILKELHITERSVFKKNFGWNLGHDED